MTGKALILSEMTWPEAKEALAQADVALVPVGSFEQHGPNGTFEVDTGRAYGFGKLLAARFLGISDWWSGDRALSLARASLK